MQEPSLVVVRGGYSLVAVCELLLAAAAALGQRTGSRAHGVQ